MENTLENKAKFFALYYGQEVKRSYLPEQTSLQVIDRDVFWIGHLIINGYLELKSIEDITDEDAYFIGALFGWEEVTSNRDTIIYNGRQIKDYINYHPNSHCDIQKYYQLLDYFRSKGYALPWMGLSVEKLIEYGWVKLKNKE
ncbi:hypothetical protein CMU91_14980 [Elizabethkingia anophelis]|nr:hypothetical protein [Elizabethkingia anophelis]